MNDIKTNKKNILIFDSGIGGLHILNKIKKILPRENYIYIFDDKFFPYGEKTKRIIKIRTKNIFKKIKKIYNINIAIIACNTASITALNTLKKTFNIPIIGIFPPVKKAINITKNKTIALLATKTTLKCLHKKQIINNIINKYNCNLLTINSNKLVKIAEKKFYKKKIIISQIYNIIYPLITSKNIPDTIILGCTHFTLIKKEIKLFFSKKTKFIESSDMVAQKIKKITKPKLINNNNIKKKQYCHLYNTTKKKIKKSFFKKYGFHIFKNLIF